jgi:pyruvate,water dikinase
VSLKQKQLLDDERDVFYLTLDELRKFSELSIQYKSIVSNRKQKYTQYNIDNLPSYFSINQGESPAQQVNNSGNGRIQGRVSTPGTIRGRVRVFEKFEMPNKIDFDIMVAKFTDPGWTPLIGISKGMIIEHGGMLSHASIVSRELGMPTIIGVTGATRVLKTGQMVEINGSTGQIEIIN